MGALTLRLRSRLSLQAALGICGVRVVAGGVEELHVGVRRLRRPGSRVAELLLVVPVAGAAVVAAASLSPGPYRVLVKEDGVLEWAQVAAYVALVVVAAVGVREVWQRERSAALVVAGLALLALLSVGEELSWGQRILEFHTPGIADQNRQGELTLHNDARVEDAARLAFFLAGLYGVVGPLLVRPTPLVPPRALVSFFGVAACYMGVRLLFMKHPGYAEAKYSEWPELCLALGLLLWCASLTARRRHLDRSGGSDQRDATALRG